MISNRALLLLPLFCLALTGCEEAPDLGFQGVVELDERVVSFEVAGRVEAVPVRRGQIVEPGQVLAALDDTLARSVVLTKVREADSAQAELALLQSGARPEEVNALAARLGAARARQEALATRLGRQRALNARGVSSREALDTLQGAHASASHEVEALTQDLRALRTGAREQELESALGRAEAARARVALESSRLQRHRLKALDAGTVLDVHVKTGEFASAGAPVVTLGDPRKPFVDVFVPQGRLEGLREGTSATLWTDSCPEALIGRVEHVGRRTEFTPRFVFSERERHNLVVRVRVRIDDPDGRLHVGVPAFVFFAGQLEGKP